MNSNDLSIRITIRLDEVLNKYLEDVAEINNMSKSELCRRIFLAFALKDIARGDSVGNK